MDKDRLSKAELEVRFGGCQGNGLFRKEKPTGDQGNIGTMAEFAERHSLLRLMLQDLAIPRIKEIFRMRVAAFNVHYPECKTFEDFLYLYKTGTYDNRM